MTDGNHLLGAQAPMLLAHSGGRPRLEARLLATAVTILASLAPSAITSNEPQRRFAHVRGLGDGVSSVRRAGQSPEQSPRALSRNVRALHELSGLTWEQLARLFGVSRRAIHFWANGGNMTARNAQTLSELVNLFRSLTGPDPASRRSELLAVDDSGKSFYERLLDHYRQAATVIDGSYLPPERLLGVLAEDE